MIDALPTLKVLRKVENLSPAARVYLADEYNRRRKSIDPLTDHLRGDVIDPSSGWVDSDIPRDESISLEITENSVGYAVAGPYGNIIRQFSDFATADKARTGAKVTLNVDVAVEGIEDEDEPIEGRPEVRTRNRVPV